MISLPRDKEAQAQVLTEALKKQANEISQDLEEVFGPILPVVVQPPAEENSLVVEVPKKLKDKMRLADQIFENTGRIVLRTNLLTRIYSHLQTRNANANAGTK
jgi:hypothetical protein